MKVLFSGGGTLGPVTPLLALYETIQEGHPNAKAVWVGTKRGPERLLVEKQGIPFLALSAGKLRRYFSLWNIFDLIRILIGFFKSLILLWQEQPTFCVSAGGFVSVPLHWAAWLLGIPTWIHQQDVRVGLANKLMAPVATQITTALEQSVSEFPKKKTTWLGNPIRKELFSGSTESARARFGLRSDLPVVFATGGGTGSLRVNQLVTEALQHIDQICQVIHLSGKERPQELVDRAKRHHETYHPYQFFTEEMKDAYAVADVVISRGGFGTITEMAALQKPAILVPKPGHQDENVRFLTDAGAALLLQEQTQTGNHLAAAVKELIEHKERREQLGSALHALLPPAKRQDLLHIVDTLKSRHA